MKKFILGVMIFALTAAGRADTVNINVNDIEPNDCGGGTFSIEYSVSDANLARAFALDISVDNGAVISGISDYFVGVCSASAQGYGIFPGGIVIDSNGNVTDYNIPVAPFFAPDSPGQLGSNSITIEMGSLYTGANSPGTSGELAGFTITGANDCNLYISTDSLRVGIVMENTAITATPNLPGSVPLVFECLYAGRVFQSGLVVTQAMVDRWKNTGPDCVNRALCWCCEAQKFGEATGTTGRVTLADLAMLKRCWMKYACEVGYCPCADFDLSGRITLADLAKIKQNWMSYPGHCCSYVGID